MKIASTDHILSISAIITAVVAVWIAVVEQQSNREYQRLSVQPYLEMGVSNADGFTGYLINNGLGPAQIKSVDIKVDGKSTHDWREVVDILVAKGAPPFVVSDVPHGRQIMAGEQVALITLNDENSANKFFANMARMSASICYCSIYLECWLAEGNSVPQPVSACPSDAPRGFPN